MQVAIDKFGRMVLPKSVREDFNLSAGSVLTVEERYDAIVLKPLEQKNLVKEDGGILVYDGEVDADISVEIKRARQERLDRSGGLK